MDDTNTQQVQSEAELKLLKKLCEVMSEIGSVEKRGINDEGKYYYAREVDIVHAVRQKLIDKGIVMIPSMSKENGIDIKGSGQSRLTSLVMDYTFFDTETGAQKTFTVPGQGCDSQDKGVYKAITGAKKYALTSIFLIPTDDDPENDSGQIRPSQKTLSEHDGLQYSSESAENNSQPSESVSGEGSVQSKANQGSDSDPKGEVQQDFSESESRDGVQSQGQSGDDFSDYPYLGKHGVYREMDGRIVIEQAINKPLPKELRDQIKQVGFVFNQDPEFPKQWVRKVA